MKFLIPFILFAFLVASCDANKKTIKNNDVNTGVENDTIRIANDELEYEIIVIDSGFNSFLLTQPPRGHYDLNFLEGRNRIYVQEYNIRARNPQQYDFNLYPQSIDYNTSTSYGYEVNYLLYNYFQFFAKKYKQRFPGLRQ